MRRGRDLAPRPADRQRFALMRAVTGRLEAAGYLVLRPQARLSTKWGRADVVAVGHGRLLFVLVGPAGRGLSLRRQHLAENVRRCGGEFLVVRGPEDVARIVQADSPADGPGRMGPPPKAEDRASLAAVADPVRRLLAPRACGRSRGGETGAARLAGR